MLHDIWNHVAPTGNGFYKAKTELTIFGVVVAE